MMNIQKARRRSSATSSLSKAAKVQVDQHLQESREVELGGLMSAQLRERLFGHLDNNSQHNTMISKRNLNHQRPLEYEHPHSTTSARRSRNMITIGKQLASARIESILASVAIAICLFSGHLQPSCVDGAKLPDIYWNSSNPIFRIDNTDHIFDVNKKLHDHDQVDLVCPQAPAAGAEPATNKSGDLGPSERYIIYSVSKDEYDTCRLQPASTARPVAICDQAAAGKPNRPPITITFRSFTPQPNGLEFKPGQDYYFITALNQPAEPGRRFAPCREQNMKVIFKICCKSAHSSGTAATQSALGNMLPNRKPLPSSPQQAHNTRQTQQQSAARAAVITVRPTFKPAGGFVPTAPAQQPVTVLPIEDIRPPEESSEPAASGEPTATPDQDSSTANDIKSEILNEQPQLPAHMQPWSESRSANSPAKNPLLISFDPNKRPEALNRWAPTPLPPRLLPLDLAQPKQFPWQQEPAAAGRSSGSRITFYPWKPIVHEAVPAQPQEPEKSQTAGTASSAPTLALALLLPLFALVILLALGLERRLR